MHATLEVTKQGGVQPSLYRPSPKLEIFLNFIIIISEQITIPLPVLPTRELPIQGVGTTDAMPMGRIAFLSEMKECKYFDSSKILSRVVAGENCILETG